MSPRIRAILKRGWVLFEPWQPIVLGLVAAIVTSATFLQWSRPFIEHDDWDMLLPDGPTYVQNHTTRLLHEGRWLNYWLWKLGTDKLDAQTAAIAFSVAWLVAVAIVIRALNIRWWSLPATVALACAPMVSELSYWPATLAGPMAALALTLTASWLTRNRLVTHLIVTALGVILVVLGYPPLALILVPFLVSLHYEKSRRDLVVIGAAFASAYIAGVLTAFALNSMRFGYFGIEIQAWRDPTPLNSLSALGNHVAVAANDYGGLLRIAAIPFTILLVGIIASVRQRALRPRLAICLVALAGAMALNSASTITDGTFTPFRAMGWVWAFVVLVLSWWLANATPSRRLMPAVALVLIAAWSATYWAVGVVNHQGRQDAIDRVADQIITLNAISPSIPALFAVPADKLRADPGIRTTGWLLGNLLVKEGGGIEVDPCRKCQPIWRYIRHHRVKPTVFYFNGNVVVRMDPRFKREALKPAVYPRWLVPYPR